MTKTSKTNAPVDEIRIGVIKAAIWQNPLARNNSRGNPRQEAEDGVRYNISFQRLYRSDEGWHSTESFGYQDLLLLAKVASEAHTRVHDLIQAQRAESRA